jgi:hypothetical protein
MQLINMTPHALTLYTADGVVELPVSGQLARVRSSSVFVGEVGGMPVYENAFSEVEGLPEPQEGVHYVTSSLVLKALKTAGISRPDVLAPGTGPNDGPIRDQNGRIVGVTRLIRE